MNRNTRISQAKIDAMFTDRWSPRSFNSKPLQQWEIDSLLEAAKWAPSCYNEQPCSFACASTPQDIKLLATALVEINQQWAPKAGLLMFLVINRNFTQTDKSNNWASFDAGASWMALALQARKLGLYTHCMAGFNKQKAAEILNVNLETHDIAVAIAAGHIGPKENLPEKLATMEQPNDRKELKEMLWKWK